MPFRILLSYYYYKNTDIPRLVESFPEPPEVFADSGAYSAYWQNVRITVPEYAEWLKRWDRYWTAYVSLDAIGDAEQSYRNHCEMEALGLHPLPVFHGGEPWEYLDRYVGRYPYMALGGMVGSSDDAVIRWLVAAFERGQAAGTVFHGFGQTKQRMVASFPWYSVDSSSWGSGHRFGQLHLWDDKRARFVHVGVGKARQIYANAALIRAHGGDPEQLARPDFSLRTDREHEVYRHERAHVIAVNVAAWLRFEGWMQRRHGPVVIPGEKGAQGGPKVYLADARGKNTDQDLAIAAREPGVKVYFAEGVPRNLRMAAEAALHIEEG